MPVLFYGSDIMRFIFLLLLHDVQIVPKSRHVGSISLSLRHAVVASEWVARLFLTWSRHQFAGDAGANVDSTDRSKCMDVFFFVIFIFDDRVRACSLRKHLDALALALPLLEILAISQKFVLLLCIQCQERLMLDV